VAGNPDSSTVVVFLHTSFDAGNIAFWHLFKDWEPPFYAVAMDTPGDLTVGPSSSTPCTNTTQSSPCAGTMMDIPYYCDAGLEAHAAWYDRKFAALAPVGSGKRLICAGHSLGAISCQEYMRRGTLPELSGLILLSQATDALWGQLYEYTLSNGYYTGYGDFVTAIRMLSTLENSSYSNSGMWGYMHPVLNQELWWWDQYSPNFATELNWLETTTCGDLARKYSRSELYVPPMPHLLIYGVDETGTRFSWDFQNGPTQSLFNKEIYSGYCERTSQCTLKWATLPDFTSQCEMVSAYADNKTACLDDVLWGHWPHVDNPLGVRQIIEDWFEANM